jgi:dimethylargininase
MTAVDDRTLLVNRVWVPGEPLDGLDVIEVDAAEPAAGNVIRVGETLVYPAAHPRTRERLERAGFSVRTVDVSELAKAEGAVTCCSLIFQA